MTQQDWQSQLKKIKISGEKPKKSGMSKNQNATGRKGASKERTKVSKEQKVQTPLQQELSSEELFQKAVQELEDSEDSILAKYSLHEPAQSQAMPAKAEEGAQAGNSGTEEGLKVSDQNLFLEAFSDVTEAAWRKSKRSSGEPATPRGSAAKGSFVVPQNGTDLDLRREPSQKAGKLLANLVDRSARLQTKELIIEYDLGNRSGSLDLLSGLSTVEDYAEHSAADFNHWYCVITLK